MRTCALASGSSGNAFYIENDKNAILIDAGISSKQIVERLNNNGKNAEKIKAIFVTHEHIDHVRGIDVFARMFNVPIFLTRKTAENCFVCSDKSLINFIKNNETVHIAGFDVNAFSKPHDCVDPVSYSIQGDKTVSIITDIGHASKNVCNAVSDSDLLFVESNHDSHMLINGPYPASLKKRILSKYGHLSNFQSSICLLEHASSRLKNIVLAHLSEVNNTPNIAMRTMQNLIKERKDLKPKICVSGRYEATELFRV